MPPSKQRGEANRAAVSPLSPRVRRLAESTALATGEIFAMIQGIQNRTRSAIVSMASGNLTVEQGVVTTNQAGEALTRIIGMAERVDRMIAQIAIATSQQAAAANQSSSSLDAIDTLSHENLTEMATTTTGIESLRARQTPSRPGRPLPPRSPSRRLRGKTCLSRSANAFTPHRGLIHRRFLNTHAA